MEECHFVVLSSQMTKNNLKKQSTALTFCCKQKSLLPFTSANIFDYSTRNLIAHINEMRFIPSYQSANI